MNFEKKLSEAYIEFKEAMDKKNGKSKDDNDKGDRDDLKDVKEETGKKKKTKEIDHLPIVENNFEDLLFTISQASNKM